MGPALWTWPRVVYDLEIKIGLAGPIMLSLLNELLNDCPVLPPGLNFAQPASMVPELIGRGHEVAIFALAHERTVTAYHRGRGWEIHVSP